MSAPSDEAIALLEDALASEGVGIANDAARLTGILKDAARGRLDREIEALVAAVKAGVISELLERRAAGGDLDGTLEKRLTGLVAERVSGGDARWSVEAWCKALGLSRLDASRSKSIAGQPRRGPTPRPAHRPTPSHWTSFALGAFLAIVVGFGYTQLRHFASAPPRATLVSQSAARPIIEMDASRRHSVRGAIVRAPARTTAFALCGSNTIGSQLGPDLARAFLSSLGSASPAIRTVGTDEAEVVGRANGRDVEIPIAAHGSATAFEGLRSGDCRIGMASRAIKTSEVQSLRSLGNMRSGRAEHVIGLDGIAVIVNAANPVSTLSMQQLEDIFTGRTRTWNGFGAGSSFISVLARDDKSGTYDTFKTLVLGSNPLVPSARRFEDSATLSAAVSSNRNAIGFIGLPYVNDAKALRIASGATPVAPTTLTVGRENYPLTRRLFLYTAATPRDPLVDRFIAFVESDAGQRIVNRDGFVGTVTSLATSKSTSRSLPSGTSAEYRTLVDHYDQTSFNFYFNSGSDELDNKALVDLGRLLSLLSTNGDRGKSVVLAGFADSTGDPAGNVRLSKSRVQAVARELRAQGIRVKETVGFGEQLPIRDNATVAGREKNRRVEIFLTR